MRLAYCFVALALVGCGSSGSQSGSAGTQGGSGPTNSAGGTPLKVDPEYLWQAYGDNQPSADGAYRGKLLEFTVGNHKVMSNEGTYCIGIKTVEHQLGYTPAQFNALSEQQKRWFQEGYPPTVLCYLASQNAGQSAKVTNGSKLRGTCTGRRDDSSVLNGYVVVLRECEIVD